MGKYVAEYYPANPRLTVRSLVELNKRCFHICFHTHGYRNLKNAISNASPVRVVALSAFASMASMRMCDSMLVGLGQEFAVTTGEASAVIAYAAVTYGVLQIFYGPLGDRIGKLRVIGAASMACALGKFAAPD